MSYQTPAPYKCEKCAREIKWTPDDFGYSPRCITKELHKAPICPNCWNEWLLTQFGPMKRVEPNKQPMVAPLPIG